MSVEVPEVRALVHRPGAGLVAHRAGRWAAMTWRKLWERGARFETWMALWYTFSALAFGRPVIRVIWGASALLWWGTRAFKLKRVRELEAIRADTARYRAQAVQARFEINRLEAFTYGPGTDQLTPDGK